MCHHHYNGVVDMLENTLVTVRNGESNCNSGGGGGTDIKLRVTD